MSRYIAVMLDLQTREPVTTTVVEAESDHEACVKAAEEADKDGYELGDIVPCD
jgi:hypothetical protein